jgi:hypothetical protein
LASDGSKAVDTNNSPVAVDFSREPRLALKASEIAIVYEFPSQNLYGHRGVSREVMGGPHRPHGPLTNFSVYAIQVVEDLTRR